MDPNPRQKKNKTTQLGLGSPLAPAPLRSRQSGSLRGLSGNSVCTLKAVTYTVFISLSWGRAVYLPLKPANPWPQWRPPTPASCPHVTTALRVPVGARPETLLH